MGNMFAGIALALDCTKCFSQSIFVSSFVYIYFFLNFVKAFMLVKVNFIFGI